MTESRRLVQADWQYIANSPWRNAVITPFWCL